MRKAYKGVGQVLALSLDGQTGPLGPEQVAHGKWRQCVLILSRAIRSNPKYQKVLKYRVGLQESLLSSISHWSLSHSC